MDGNCIDFVDDIILSRLFMNTERLSFYKLKINKEDKANPREWLNASLRQ